MKERTWHTTARTALVFALTYVLVWGGFPALAMAEMTQGDTAKNDIETMSEEPERELEANVITEQAEPADTSNEQPLPTLVETDSAVEEVGVLAQSGENEITVSGNIAEDTVWEGEGLVVNLAGDINIKNTAMLTICSGVTVRGNGYKVNNYGTLDVDEATITNTHICACNTSYEPCTITIRNSSVSGGSLMKPGGGSEHAVLTLEGNVFVGLSLSSDIYIWYPSGVVRITRNVFDRCGYLSIGSNSNVFITNNVFHSTAIENWAQYGGNCYVEGNSFYGAGVQLRLKYNSSSMIAKSNYWGTTDESVIRQRVVDGDVDYSIAGTIEYLPILTEPAEETPAFEHPFGDWEVVTEPDYGVVGKKVRTCTICGIEEQEEIPSLKYSVEDCEVTGIVEKTYNAEAQTQNPTVKMNGRTLVEGEEYELSYRDNTNAGTAYVIITGLGDCEGTKEIAFNIAKANVESATVTNVNDCTYTGEAQTQEPVVVVGTRTLVAGDDYNLSYTGNADAGTATMTIVGVGNYTGMRDVEFTVSKASLANADITDVQEKTYDGTSQAQTPTVKVGERTLELDTDYELSYTNNVNVGIATMAVAGIGNYQGEKNVEFQIARRPATVTGNQVIKEYGTEDPELVAVDGLVEGDELSYDVSREQGEALGEYTITPSGAASQGNYSVTYVPGKLTITRADLANAEIAPIEGKLRTGSAIEPLPAVSMRGRPLTLGTDYTLSYENNVEPGTATVTITGKGNYTGAKAVEFRIGTRSLGDATLTLGQGLGQDLFPASAVPAEPVVSAYVPDPSDPFERETLREGRDFTVSYRDNESVGTATAVVTGAGDWVGTAELNFRIAEKIDISDPDVRAHFWTLGEDGKYCDSFVYRGSNIEPTVVMGPGPLVAGAMVEGRDFEVSYLACDAPGNAIAVVTGIGDYTGEQTLAYTIVDPSRVSLRDASTSLESPVAWKENENSGEYIETYLREEDVDPRPVPSVYVGGAILEEGADYEVDYYYEHYSDNDPNQMDMGLCVVRGINGVSGEAYHAFYVVDRVDVAWLNLGVWDLRQQEYLWEGVPVRPKLLPRDGFVEDRDYYLSYRNNNGVGTCTVTVSGLGTYYGTATVEVPVVDELSFTPYSECEVEVVVPEGGIVYDGAKKCIVVPSSWTAD